MNELLPRVILTTPLQKNGKKFSEMVEGDHVIEVHVPYGRPRIEDGRNLRILMA